MAQAELNRTVRAYEELRQQPAIIEATAGNLDEQVKGLTERKQALDAEVAALRSDLEAYRKANP